MLILRILANVALLSTFTLVAQVAHVHLYIVKVKCRCRGIMVSSVCLIIFRFVANKRVLHFTIARSKVIISFEDEV